MEVNVVLHGDAIKMLKTLPDNSVHCIVTSPPYYAQRDYNVAGQIGLEDTPELFISVLVEVFREIYRIMRPDASLWLNIGDSYWGGKGKSGQSYSAEAQGERYASGESYNKAYHQIGGVGKTRPSDRKHPLIKPKDLVGIPWMLAFALRDQIGYYLRQDIIWHKTTSMPESVQDRCTKNHEYLFLLTKSAKYFYDYVAIMQDAKNPQDDVRRLNAQSANNKTVPDDLMNGLRPRKSGNKERKNGSERGCPENSGSNVCSNVPWEGVKANKRSVWTVTPRAFSDAHFATYPEELIVDCIKAGSSEYGCCSLCGAPYSRIIKSELVPTYKASHNTKVDKRDIVADANDAGSNRVKDGHKPGYINSIETLEWLSTCGCVGHTVIPCIVLDPFFGAGTTGLVARKLNRNYIGIELNKSYIEDIAKPRLKRELGFFH